MARRRVDTTKGHHLLGQGLRLRLNSKLAVIYHVYYCSPSCPVAARLRLPPSIYQYPRKPNNAAHYIHSFAVSKIASAGSEDHLPLFRPAYLLQSPFSNRSFERSVRTCIGSWDRLGSPSPCYRPLHRHSEIVNES